MIDVKAWREAWIESGRLWRADVPAGEEVQKLLNQTLAVEQVLAEAGQSTG